MLNTNTIYSYSSKNSKKNDLKLPTTKAFAVMLRDERWLSYKKTITYYKMTRLLQLFFIKKRSTQIGQYYPICVVVSTIWQHQENPDVFILFLLFYWDMIGTKHLSFIK